MTIQKIKSGRVTTVDADQFIGDLGQIFYNESLGDLRLSDGMTPGGIPLSVGSGGGGGNANIIVRATAPNGVTTGTLWYNTTDRNLYVYYSGSWRPATVQNYTDANVTQSDTAPVRPKSGDLWFDTSVSYLKIYYGGDWVTLNLQGQKGDPGSAGAAGAAGASAYDVAVANGFVGTVQQWLQSLVGATGPAGTSASVYEGTTSPTDPHVGDLWYNTAQGNLYVYYNNTWAPATTTSNIDLTAVSSNIVPTLDNFYDLGLQDKQWRHVWIGGGTLYLGGVEITNTSGNIVINAPITIQNTDGIKFSDGTAQYSAVPGSFILPKATRSQTGVVEVGDNINVDGFGTISVPKGAGINTVIDIPDVYTGGPSNPNLTAGSMMVYNNGAKRWDTTTMLIEQDMDGGEF